MFRDQIFSRRRDAISDRDKETLKTLCVNADAIERHKNITNLLTNRKKKLDRKGILAEAALAWNLQFRKYIISFYKGKMTV